MSEIKQNLEQGSETIAKPELLPSDKEQKEGLKMPEKIQETEPVKKSDIQGDDQVSTQEQASQGSVSDSLTATIDDILEEGLEDIYLNMSREEQKEFKVKGEETTTKIVALLSETKIKVKKIVQIIIEWLKIISGVNKFFIKQTAKIKTDKILDAQKKESPEL